MGAQGKCGSCLKFYETADPHCPVCMRSTITQAWGQNAVVNHQMQQGLLGQTGLGLQQAVNNVVEKVQQAHHEHYLIVDPNYDALVCACGVRVSGECMKAAGFTRIRQHDQHLADEAQKWRDEASRLALELKIAEGELSRLQGTSRKAKT